MSSRVVSLSVAMFTAAEIAAAQVIPIQTVPLVPADQFDIFPSLGLAMGGVSIALADTLHDPFVNPATGARLRTAHLLGSPTFYGVSDDAGAGRTFRSRCSRPPGRGLAAWRWRSSSSMRDGVPRSSTVSCNP